MTVAGRSFQPAWYREAEKPREHFRLRLLLLRIRLPQPHCSYTLYLQVYRYTVPYMDFFLLLFFSYFFFSFFSFFLFLPRLPSPLPFISKGYHLYPLLVSFFSHPSFRSCLLFAIFMFSLPRVHTTASPSSSSSLLSRSCTTGWKLNPVIILFDRSGVD